MNLHIPITEVLFPAGTSKAADTASFSREFITEPYASAVFFLDVASITGTLAVELQSKPLISPTNWATVKSAMFSVNAAGITRYSLVTADGLLGELCRLRLTGTSLSASSFLLVCTLRPQSV